jgi:hypothetical protein
MQFLTWSVASITNPGAVPLGLESTPLLAIANFASMITADNCSRKHI